MDSITFSFYGTTIQFDSENEKLLEDIQRDFSFFKTTAVKAWITIKAYNRPPPYKILPAMQASYVSPRNSCYYYKGIKYIDYSGYSLVIYDKKSSVCDIYSGDYELLHEICYMAALSLINEKLDKRHIHRVHGLGLAVDNKAVLILLDIGGGKTTLAMGLFTSGENIKLISEDSPLLNPQGEVLPFPIRIGVCPQEVPPAIPKKYQRYFAREESGPKILIDIEYFKEKICHNPCQPSIIIIGRRVLGREPSIKAASKYLALKEFLKNSVIGLGLYQGIEYVFQKGPKEIVRKIPLGISRLNNALKAINRSKTFEFYLSPAKDKNSQLLIEFLKNLPC